jgi:Polyketide cyclase / dehydrase and lipid transport
MGETRVRADARSKKLPEWRKVAAPEYRASNGCSQPGELFTHSHSQPAMTTMRETLRQGQRDRHGLPHVATTAYALVGFALALLSSARFAAAAVISIDAGRDGAAIDIHASAVLNADATTAWRVLTDYGHYTAFIPDLRQSRVVARHDATVTVEQSGDAMLWRFKIPLDITFEIEESAPDSVRSHATAGSLRALTSSYVLTPVAEGVRLNYVGRVTPGYALLGQLEQSVVERNVGRQFQALADEIERQYAAAPKAPRDR